MYKLCVFAGTSEGRQLVKWLASFEGLSVTACAARLLSSTPNSVIQPVMTAVMISPISHSSGGTAS